MDTKWRNPMTKETSLSSTTISVKDLIGMRKNGKQETERESIQRENNCFFLCLSYRSKWCNVLSNQTKCFHRIYGV